ncbi:MAG: FAD-binding oxidoreductase [Gammaproteobacteria bacterium]|nr:FAD-binding oxidoreductase [Gammaproteobacteria bacterium]MCP5425497.1 FAD-binding oxidoreductase [Gammaproteobacteria bacterium]MCP5459383.1 FAD-binding oxidoreductase [Gammaproteobacteria bacterium]
MNAVISDTLLADLRAFLDPAQIASDPDSRQYYGRDWTRLYPPEPLAVVFPGTTEQVQQLVAYANRQGLALVPSGGRTGLSGAAVASHGELVVSFERMNRILAFNAIDRYVTCQPGVVTEVLQQYARAQGLFYPVDFAARGSSHIGGNIATNAGGIKVIRYGLTRDWVMGLKVVTGKGDLLNLNKGLVKNASGYDLRHLFIGSEGTLGFIVEATLKLTTTPRSPSVMLFGVPALDGIMAIFDACQNRLSLNAFEFFSEKALRHVLAKNGLQRPFETATPYYVLVEFENTSQETLDAALAVFEQGGEEGWLADGVISQSESQAAELWALRERISESISSHTPYKNDLSVRVSQVPAFLSEVDAVLSRHYPDFEVVWFGHIGDGNLHVNVLKPPALDMDSFVGKCQTVNQLLFDAIAHYEGSISAEHGVGLTKKPYLGYTRDAAEIAYMRAMKQVFDPNGIMNPGKIFD